MLARAASSTASSPRDSPITPRVVDFSAWYADVVAAADLSDASPVRGCSILKPNGYAIWESIQRNLDARIRATGVRNAYFPLLVPAALLSREAAHVSGFAKEAAVVTHTRLRARADGKPGVEVDPESALAEPLIIRPTSEAVIWDALRRWIHSQADLPVLLNQWANVMRWEMRPRPFVRTSEFLWQEGHTAHAEEGEARERAAAMHVLYSQFLSEVLALPCTAGSKSPGERFAGAVDTLTCEVLVQNGWALQAATSHFLGTNFSHAFDVTYVPRVGGGRHPVWATSWGASTRLIGAAIMGHSDDVGLVLPPSVAPVQVVLLPVAPRRQAEAEAGVAVAAAIAAAERAASVLAAAGMRVEIDRDVRNGVGARAYRWERRGTPLRLEVGARELAANAVTARTRVPLLDTTLPMQLRNDGSLTDSVRRLFVEVHAALLASATSREACSIRRTERYDDLRDASAVAEAAISSGSPAPLDCPAFLAPWCEDSAAEASVQAETRFTLRCYPANEQRGTLDTGAALKCFYSGRPATHVALFARAF